MKPINTYLILIFFQRKSYSGERNDAAELEPVPKHFPRTAKEKMSAVARIKSNRDTSALTAT